MTCQMQRNQHLLTINCKSNQAKEKNQVNQE